MTKVELGKLYVGQMLRHKRSGLIFIVGEADVYGDGEPYAVLRCVKTIETEEDCESFEEIK
jgi:hypothetical protein